MIGGTSVGVYIIIFLVVLFAFNEELFKWLKSLFSMMYYGFWMIILPTSVLWQIMAISTYDSLAHEDRLLLFILVSLDFIAVFLICASSKKEDKDKKTDSKNGTNGDSNSLITSSNRPLQHPINKSIPASPQTTSVAIVTQARPQQPAPMQKKFKLTPTSSQTQRELDRWKSKWKSNEEIGREYERYIGYLFEIKGLKVVYFGATEGKKDMGRDLIVKDGKSRRIVQCKYWGKDKIVHEKHIGQLYATTIVMATKDPEHTYKGVFVTNVTISETAKDFAKTTGIEVHENIPMISERPMIKCNLNRERERIYHLPFDSTYDHVQIGGKKGSFYAWTVAEAEEKGFRRAFYKPQI